MSYLSLIEACHLVNQAVKLCRSFAQHLNPEMFGVFNGRHIHWTVNTAQYVSVTLLRTDITGHLTSSRCIYKMHQLMLSGNALAQINTDALCLVWLILQLNKPSQYAHYVTNYQVNSSQPSFQDPSNESKQSWWVYYCLALYVGI